MMHRSFLLLLSLVLGVAHGRAAEAAKTVDFTRDIQPILTRSCLKCHDARKQRGGLRLDQGQAALRGGDSGIVIKPGDAAHSRL
ncbi:MAG TPA: c-type cytochrome domain-containing protein, partial [Gemmataceae bacterium]